MINKCLTSHLVSNFIDAFHLSAIFGFITTLATILFPGISEWFYINESYVNIALGCLALDHLLGSLVHSNVYRNDFCWKKNITGFGIKLTMIIAFAFLMEGLAHVTMEDDMIYRYVKMSGRILVILYPGMSAMRNIKIVTNGVFPPDAIIGKLENFNRDLDLDKLKKGNDAESE